ncbi:MAG: ABC transporter substrate-binding protein, partial [Aquabacterium sp.]
MSPNRKTSPSRARRAAPATPVGITRRQAAALVGAGAAAALAPAGAWAAAQQAEAAGKKVLRFAFSSGETSLDPARIVDLYSRNVTPHIFEGLYTYDHLARPVLIKPALAEALPEISPDFRTFTVKVRRGIYFADDPAFKGRKREMTAGDFVYQFKRIVDPVNKSPVVAGILETGFIGLKGLRERALAERKP